MPKRVIDGDALWVSEKLTSVPEKYRAEYAWLLPLAQANGCFECSPMLVWRTCYSALRPEWNIDSVTEMLNEFERAKMLFRFKVADKTFGFFVGMQMEGRLPKPSDRVKSAKQWQSGMLPEKQLARFLGVSVSDLSRDYRDLLATNSRPTRGKVADKSPTGNGIGNGSGDGTGSGEGNGVGTGYGSGEGNGAATLLNTATLSPATLSITSSLQHSNAQHGNTSTLNTQPYDVDADENEPSSTFDGYSAIKFTRLFTALMKENPNASAPPKGWESMWVDDFKRLLGFISASEVADVIAVSQLDKNKPFHVRPTKLIENLSLLQQMIQERKKIMPVLRTELRKTADRLGV